MIAFDKILVTAVGALAFAAIPKVAAASCSAVNPPFFATWQAHFAQLGDCESDEISDDVGGGKYQLFQYGTIDWNGNSGSKAFEVNGLIAQKWNAIGGAFWFGQPISNEISPQYAYSGEKMNIFTQNGATKWLVYNPGTSGVPGTNCNAPFEVCQVYGEIGVWWNSLQGAGQAGWPVNEQYSKDNGAHEVQDFTEMTITWNKSNGNVCFYTRAGALTGASGYPC